MMDKKSKILVVAVNSGIATVIKNKLNKLGYTDVSALDSTKLDLMDKRVVFDFYMKNKPEYVICFLELQRYINSTNLADIMHETMEVYNNIIHDAYLCNVKRLLFLLEGSEESDIVSVLVRNPNALSGDIQSALFMLKNMGIQMCMAYNQQYNTEFIPVVLTNYYGFTDDTLLKNDNILSLITRIYQAKEMNEDNITVYVQREVGSQYIYIDDLVDAIIYIMVNVKNINFIKLSSGERCKYIEVIDSIKKTIGYHGNIMIRLLEEDHRPCNIFVERQIFELKWNAKVSLIDGINYMYIDYRHDDTLIEKDKKEIEISKTVESQKVAGPVC